MKLTNKTGSIVVIKKTGGTGSIEVIDFKNGDSDTFDNNDLNQVTIDGNIYNREMGVLPKEGEMKFDTEKRLTIKANTSSSQTAQYRRVNK